MKITITYDDNGVFISRDSMKTRVDITPSCYSKPFVDMVVSSSVVYACDSSTVYRLRGDDDIIDKNNHEDWIKIFDGDMIFGMDIINNHLKIIMNKYSMTLIGRMWLCEKHPEDFYPRQFCRAKRCRQHGILSMTI